MISRFVLIFCAALIFQSSICFSSDSSNHERGLFIWSLEDQPVFCNAAKTKQAIDFAATHDIKTLFVQVYRSNRAWFASKIADREPYEECLKGLGQDPLEFFIKQAHANGIEVHAWMNMLSLSGNKDAFILKKYGRSILTSNRTPKRKLEDYKIDNQYFLEPGDARVRNELLKVVEELLRMYPHLDGIQFDYIRYPDVHPFYGYSPDNIKRFKRATKIKTINDKDPRWQQFKRDQVTEFLRELIHRTRSINPYIHISTTGCLSYTRAMEEAFQEWPLWINTNMIEFITLMNYPPDVPTFEKNIQEIKPWVNDFSKVNMAVGAYKKEQTKEDFKRQMESCRASGARSCVIFHYDSLIQKSDLIQTINN